MKLQKFMPKPKPPSQAAKQRAISLQNDRLKVEEHQEREKKKITYELNL